MAIMKGKLVSAVKKMQGITYSFLVKRKTGTRRNKPILKRGYL